jgi:N-acetylneuraminate synthase
MPELYIGKRRISPDDPPLIVPEVGINHNGSLAIAKIMVDAAIAAGAEVIKHQTHVIDDEMSDAARKVIPGNADVSIYEIMESCALNESDERALQAHVEAQGAAYISTPFSRAAADRLQAMNVPAFKIGSGECNNYPLIEHVADFGKPIILSTGMNTIPSIRRAVEILRSRKIQYALLHCTNVYPTPPSLVRLGALSELQEAFPDAVIGLSDHTVSNYACLGAVALGAAILERHFTDSMVREGPDIVCSMDPDAFVQLKEGAQVIFEARGGTKGPVAEEQPTIDFAFATVVTIRPVAAGEAFSRENAWVKRPGTGAIPAAEFDAILGKKASRDLPASIHLERSDIAPSD